MKIILTFLIICLSSFLILFIFPLKTSRLYSFLPKNCQQVWPYYDYYEHKEWKKFARKERQRRRQLEKRSFDLTHSTFSDAFFQEQFEVVRFPQVPYIQDFSDLIHIPNKNLVYKKSQTHQETLFLQGGDSIKYQSPIPPGHYIEFFFEPLIPTTVKIDIQRQGPTTTLDKPQWVRYRIPFESLDPIHIQISLLQGKGYCSFMRIYSIKPFQKSLYVKEPQGKGINILRNKEEVSNTRLLGSNIMWFNASFLNSFDHSIFQKSIEIPWKGEQTITQIAFGKRSEFLNDSQYLNKVLTQDKTSSFSILRQYGYRLFLGGGNKALQYQDQETNPYWKAQSLYLHKGGVSFMSDMAKNFYDFLLQNPHHRFFSYINLENPISEPILFQNILSSFSSQNHPQKIAITNFLDYIENHLSYLKESTLWVIAFKDKVYLYHPLLEKFADQIPQNQPSWKVEEIVESVLSLVGIPSYSLDSFRHPPVLPHYRKYQMLIHTKPTESCNPYIWPGRVDDVEGKEATLEWQSEKQFQVLPCGSKEWMKLSWWEEDISLKTIWNQDYHNFYSGRPPEKLTLLSLLKYSLDKLIEVDDPPSIPWIQKAIGSRESTPMYIEYKRY